MTLSAAFCESAPVLETLILLTSLVFGEFTVQNSSSSLIVIVVAVVVVVVLATVSGDSEFWW